MYESFHSAWYQVWIFIEHYLRVAGVYMMDDGIHSKCHCESVSGYHYIKYQLRDCEEFPSGLDEICIGMSLNIYPLMYRVFEETCLKISLYGIPKQRNIIYVRNFVSLMMRAYFLNKSAKGASIWSSPECQGICTSMVMRYEFVSGIRTLIWLWYRC